MERVAGVLASLCCAVTYGRPRHNGEGAELFCVYWKDAHFKWALHGRRYGDVWGIEGVRKLFTRRKLRAVVWCVFRNRLRGVYGAWAVDTGTLFPSGVRSAWG